MITQSSAVAPVIVVETLRMITGTSYQSIPAIIAAHCVVALLAVIFIRSFEYFASPLTDSRFSGQKVYACALPCVPAGSGEICGVKNVIPPGNVQSRNVLTVPHGVEIADFR